MRDSVTDVDRGISQESRTRDKRSTNEGSIEWGRAFYSMIMDLTTNRNRTADFLGTRANFIQDRVRALALVFAAVVFLWMGLDYVIIPDPAVVVKLALLRSLCAALYLGLAFLASKPHSLPRARAKLAALVTLPCAFYIASRFVLAEGAPPGALMVYDFFPFVVMVQLAIFPLPLLEGLMLSVPAFATLFAVEALFGEIMSLSFLGNLTLLVLLMCLALWASMSELQMLLRLYRQATRDPLTGLFNRGALMEHVQLEIGRARRYEHGMCVLLFDLDKFKRINDEFGHLAGDAVLQAFARILEKGMRQTDVVGRYGGEEFLAVLACTRKTDAESLAERIRAACADVEVSSPEGVRIEFTTSVGIAELEASEDAESLLSRVDESLYKAKDAGRDCVIVAA